MNMKRVGLIVFAVALALRLGLVVPVAKDSIRTPLSSDFTMDARAYVDVADSLVAHGVFGYGGRASAFRPPLYPWLLAGSFEVFGRDFRAVRVLQALLGALTCLALAAAGRAAFGVRAGLFAGLGLAVYPFVLYFTGELLTETLYAALVVAFAWLATRWLFDPRPSGTGSRVDGAALRLALAAGAALGLAILCRPAALFYALAAGLYALVAFVRGARGRAVELLALCAVAAVVVLPWCVRNTRTFGRPLFVTTYTGLNLYKGLPGKDDRTSAVDLGYHQHMLEDAAATLPENEAALDKRALDYWKDAVRAHPGAYLAEKLRDSARFWADVHLSGNVARLAGLVMLGALAVYFAALLLALLESVHAWRSGRLLAIAVPVTIILATWIGYAPFFAGKRFRVASVDPFLVLLAAACVDRLIAARGRASTPLPADPRTRRPAAPSADPSPR